MALAPGSEPGQAGSPAAQENGLKDGAPCDSEGPREPQALDSSIPETSKSVCVPDSPASIAGFDSNAANMERGDARGKPNDAQRYPVAKKHVKHSILYYKCTDTVWELTFFLLN